MKTRTILILFLLLGRSFAQSTDQSLKWKNEWLNSEDFRKEELKTAFLEYDFSQIWTSTPNELVYGFIGRDYQRIFIKILSAQKDVKNPAIYHITGKSKVKNIVCNFKGTIKILHIRKAQTGLLAIFKDDPEFLKKNQIKDNGLVIGQYEFREDKNQFHSGAYRGITAGLWFLNTHNKIQINNLDDGDGYQNNGFVGVWESYTSKKPKPCHWGDERIPYSNNLDTGAGEFTPNKKYLKNGWQNLYNLIEKRDTQALALEKTAWWK